MFSPDCKPVIYLHPPQRCKSISQISIPPC